jgi:bifunctional enzyme CysN/CysC
VRIAGFAPVPGRPQKREAEAGESVAVAFDADVFVERGAWITAPDTSRDAGTVLRARLLWLGDGPLFAGTALRVAVATAVRDARVSRILRTIEPGTAPARAGEVSRNGLASVEFALTGPLAADAFADLPATGRGIVLQGGRVAGGFVVETPTDALNAPAAREIFPAAEPIVPEARARANGHRPGVFWLTGLSGAGKSTLARAAVSRLFERGRQVVLLDGDDLRGGLNADLGFEPADRDENVRRTAHVARLFARAGSIVFVALISPLRAHRDAARGIVGADFHEVHVNAHIDACRARDPKGLYARAGAGEVRGFTGVSAPYEDPATPDLAIDTVALSPTEAIERLVAFVEAHATPSH